MDLPLVLTGRVVTFDEAQPVLDDGAVYIGADELIAAVQPRKEPAPAGFDERPRGAHRRRDLPRPHRPPRPHRLQRPAAVVSAGAHQALHLALPVAGRPELRGHDLRPRQRAGRAGRQGAPEVPGDQGGRRGHDRDPGHGQDRAPLRGLARAQHRVRDLPDQEEDGLRLGAPAARRGRLQVPGPAPQGQARVRLPPVRGHRSQAHRRVHDDEHRALPRPGPGRHPLHGAREGQLRRVGAARRRGRVVAVLQPVALCAGRPTSSPRVPRACASAWAPTGRPRARRTSSASSRSPTCGTARTSTAS